MDGYVPAKMKRKDLEEVYDEFSEFSLSSPARKIRRLDTELPPIMEEEELPAGPPTAFGRPLTKEDPLQDISPQLAARSSGGYESSAPLNEERALVLYKPVRSRRPFDSRQPSNVFLKVDPDVIASLKTATLASVGGGEDGSVEEAMESEDVVGSTSMDIEPGSEGLQHRHQHSSSSSSKQHCMSSQVSSSESNPVMWSWG
ncbi:unnamed protein product [Spirodela intermedia]|uniref:Uncharacterized protein n=1 Tax=Spirodela intermedia TaxID=51605 RepID=A0A7I8JLX9_SPIIN|nr:unnamed protein product [Spirodela intermedia]CAA6671177.1 unnamed protein product [Spirodela intermedia]